MKRFTPRCLVLSAVLAFVIPAGSQQTVCSDWMAIQVNCFGQSCNGGVVVLRPTFGSGPACMFPTQVWCCDAQVLDYNVGDWCSGQCNEVALLKDRGVLEFALTHTLWARDCSGHYQPFARSWDAPKRPIDLKPRLGLSGIGD